jgi:hypothetical protein
MEIKKTLPIIAYTSWCGLGYIRGIKSYTYNYNKYQKKEKEDYLYLHSLCYGVVGIGLYANPFLLPFSLYKELYRLEVNVRNLENEKNTTYYNTLW